MQVKQRWLWIKRVFLVWGIMMILNGRLVSQAQLLESVAPKASSKLAATSLFFGEEFRLNADIASEAHIPEAELYCSYKFLGDEPVRAKYSAPFIGERIPGYARKVEVEIYRQQAGTTSATKQALWTYTFEVQQIPPTFDTRNISLENTSSAKGKTPKLGECSFAIKGVKVDFAKPVDIEKNRVVTALVNDLEIADPQLDPTKIALQFFFGDKPDEKFTTALKPEQMSVSGFFDSGVFLLNVTMKGLPKVSLKGKTLRGSVGIKLSVKLNNRRAMRSATVEETLIIPISLLL